MIAATFPLGALPAELPAWELYRNWVVCTGLDATGAAAGVRAQQ